MHRGTHTCSALCGLSLWLETVLYIVGAFGLPAMEEQLEALGAPLAPAAAGVEALAGGVVERGRRGRPTRAWSDGWPVAVAVLSAGRPGEAEEYGLRDPAWCRALRGALGHELVELPAHRSSNRLRVQAVGLAVLRGRFVVEASDLPAEDLALMYAGALVRAHGDVVGLAVVEVVAAVAFAEPRELRPQTRGWRPSSRPDHMLRAAALPSEAVVWQGQAYADFGALADHWLLRYGCAGGLRRWLSHPPVASAMAAGQLRHDLRPFGGGPRGGGAGQNASILRPSDERLYVPTRRHIDAFLCHLAGRPAWQPPAPRGQPGAPQQAIRLRTCVRRWAGAGALRERPRDAFEVDFIVSCVAASRNSRNVSGFRQQGEAFMAAAFGEAADELRRVQVGGAFRWPGKKPASS